MPGREDAFGADREGRPYPGDGREDFTGRWVDDGQFRLGFISDDHQVPDWRECNRWPARPLDDPAWRRPGFLEIPDHRVRAVEGVGMLLDGHRDVPPVAAHRDR